MEQGPVEQQIIQQCLRSGMELPDKIKNAPSLLPGLELYFIAFQNLESSRETGFGIGPIWWKTIEDYCVSKGFSEEQKEACHYHLREMDTEYMKAMRRKKG